MKNEILDLLGSIVSFENKHFEKLDGQPFETVGLVVSVLINLDGNHQIEVKDLEDSVNFYTISELKKFKVAKIDSEMLFENLKLGNFQLSF